MNLHLAHPHRHREVQADKSLLLPAPVSEGRRGFLKSGQSPTCQIQGRHLKFSGDRSDAETGNGDHVSSGQSMCQRQRDNTSK